MGEEEDMEEGEAVMEEEVDTLGEEVDMEEEGKEEVDMVEEEEEEEEEETVMEEEAVTVGEEILVEKVVASKDHKASPDQALDSCQVQRWVYVYCHYTPSSLTTPSSPPHTSPLTGTRREAPVTDTCDLSPDTVCS